MAKHTSSGLHARIETEINSYLSGTVEVSDGVSFSQYQLIKRLYKFRNKNLSGTKINSDLSYDYYFDIISPRSDTEVKNLRFDTKHVLVFSRNPTADFAAVFIANAKLKEWMGENGEDEKLKSAVVEYSSNGNVGFKRVGNEYEFVDPLNTYVTNQLAETVDDTNLIERYEMSASQIKDMTAWNGDVADEVIKDLGDKSFSATALSTNINSSTKSYEIFEYSGEVNEVEYNAIKGLSGGNENNYFLAKVIVAGLSEDGEGRKYTLFAEELKDKLSDHYLYAHRGAYQGRFWRVGVYETLFDHQIRANEIGNQLARGLEWASKTVFQSSDSKILQNIRADIDNGDIIIAKDLKQVDVRMQGLDQLIADWNRLMEDADKVTNSFEVSRGESLPAGTPFRLGALLNENAGLMFVLLRQKITLVYKRVFREWILPELIKDLKGKDIFMLTGNTEILDQLRELMVDSWYYNNLVEIGPHTKEVAIAIKEEKLESLKKIDPTIKNSKEIWKGVIRRMFITITGENSDIADQVTDLVSLVQLEQDPDRRAWILDRIYRVRNIPVPPRVTDQQPTNTVNQSQTQPTRNPKASIVKRQQSPLE